MSTYKKTMVAAALLFFGAAGCADLDVNNPNDANRGQALATASDVESLISGSFNTWYTEAHEFGNTSLFLSTASFQHSAPWNNAGMVPLSRIPREPLPNFVSSQEYSNLANQWFGQYQALAAVADGLRAMEDPEIAAAIDEGATNGALRARAYGKFVQGLAHGTLGMIYDQGFILDETTETTDEAGNPVPQEAVPYTEMMNAAYGYLEEAIALADQGDFLIPAEWMMTEVSNEFLIQLAHSYRASLRASVPRTPDEAVDWQAVLDDVNAAAIDEDWIVFADQGGGWNNWVFDYIARPQWGQMSYFISGMADTGGDYQKWINTPVNNRLPYFGASESDDPFLIQTPDLRYPQGATAAEQIANPGAHWQIPTEEGLAEMPLGSQWSQAARGTWRWSWYWNSTHYDYYAELDYNIPERTVDEMELLKAEALYWLAGGNMTAEAAAIVDKTRAQFGLDSSADGINDSCVPKLPDESCGDFLEMLKWEKRHMVYAEGLMSVAWYFDSRRWGDLYKGTFLQLPIPAGELQTLEMLPVYTYGGIAEAPPSASPGSSYAWPFEGQ